MQNQVGNLQRLTTINPLDCSQPVEQASQLPEEDEFTVSEKISGAWYDESHDGEGWLLEVLPGGQALVAWFGYGPKGDQAWFLNTGTVDGNTIKFDLLMPSGPNFGPTYRPDELSFPPWGSATFKFDDCISGSMTYDSPLPGYGSGSLALTRLTELSGLECVDQN